MHLRGASAALPTAPVPYTLRAVNSGHKLDTRILWDATLVRQFSIGIRLVSIDSFSNKLRTYSRERDGHFFGYETTLRKVLIDEKEASIYT